MNEEQRLTRLEALARQDEVYAVWEEAYRDYETAFRDFADAQPDDLRQVLYGYAESGRLMYQRLVNLACQHMEFPEAQAGEIRK